MSSQGWVELVRSNNVDGTALTAAAAASCIPGGDVITLPNNFWAIGKVMRITAAGRISCVVTTPGTARYDVRMGAVVAADTGAMNLNVVAKTNVPWWLDCVLRCTAIGSGTGTTLFPFFKWQSEAVVGSPLPTAGGNGSIIAPTGAPAVGTGFNNAAANTLDLFFTQTVATGSMTLHTYLVEVLN